MLIVVFYPFDWRDRFWRPKVAVSRLIPPTALEFASAAAPPPLFIGRRCHSRSVPVAAYAARAQLTRTAPHSAHGAPPRRHGRAGRPSPSAPTGGPAAAASAAMQHDEQQTAKQEEAAGSALLRREICLLRVPGRHDELFYTVWSSGAGLRLIGRGEVTIEEVKLLMPATLRGMLFSTRRARRQEGKEEEDQQAAASASAYWP